MTTSPGEFWLAEIPYSNQLASKRRPVLLLWLDASDAIVAAVTSALPRTATDLPLVDWHSSGLRTASTVRLARLDCLEQSLLLRKLGQITAADALQIKDTWKRLIQPQF